MHQSTDWLIGDDSEVVDLTATGPVDCDILNRLGSWHRSQTSGDGIRANRMRTEGPMCVGPSGSFS
jgi:hypothetical protein